MSSTREQVLRYGANQISGYSGNRKTLSITPTSVLLPPIEIDHMDMPATFKDKDVSADTITFSSNDSTHVQTIASSGDLTISASQTGKDLSLLAHTDILVDSDQGNVQINSGVGDVRITGSTTVQIGATEIQLSGTTTGLALTQTAGSTGVAYLGDAGYYTADLTTDTGKGLEGYTCKIKMFKIGSLVTFELRGSSVTSPIGTVTAGSALVFTAAIPAALRPAAMANIGGNGDLFLPAKVQSNGAWVDASLAVDPSTGNFTLGPTNADGSSKGFTTSGGFWNVSAVWTTRAWSV